MEDDLMFAIMKLKDEKLVSTMTKDNALTLH